MPSGSDGTGEDDSAVIRDVTVHEASFILQKLQEDPDFRVIDVRGAQEWSEGTLPGAIHIELASLNFSSEFDLLDKGGTYLIFGSGAKDAATLRTVVEYFGFKEVYIITDGFGAWQEAGYTVVYPAEENKAPVVQPEATTAIAPSGNILI